LKIYKIYSFKYAKLYQLVMNENFNLSFLERIFFRFCKLLFGSSFCSTRFLKIIKNKKYKMYSINEIDVIKTNL